MGQPYQRRDKENKRLYFIILLKRANVPARDINFYCTCIRPVLEYCASVLSPDIYVRILNAFKTTVLSFIIFGFTANGQFYNS